MQSFGLRNDNGSGSRIFCLGGFRAHNLLGAQHDRHLGAAYARTTVLGDIGSFERHVEEEPKRHGAIDRRRPCTTRCQMQPIAAPVIVCCM